MDTKPIAPRHDALDTERFSDMLASPPFALLRARMTAELERARLECETQTDPLGVNRAQGRCGAMRIALALPEIMLREMKGTAK
jgi:hypothetical protein